MQKIIATVIKKDEKEVYFLECPNSQCDNWEEQDINFSRYCFQSFDFINRTGNIFQYKCDICNEVFEIDFNVDTGECLANCFVDVSDFAVKGE